MNDATVTNPELIEFATEEVAGRLLELCVTQLEKLKNPWHLVSEGTQRKHIDEMRSSINTAVLDAVHIIATERCPAIKATLERVTIDDGIKAVLSLSKSAEGRHELADATGSIVLIQMARGEQFLGGTEKVKPQADQPELALDQAADDAEKPKEPDTRQVPTGESLHEIRPFEDGFMIYKDEMPIAGMQKFETHNQAERHLQDHLGIKPIGTREKESVPEGEGPPEMPYEQKASELRKLYTEATGKKFPVGTSKVAMIKALNDLAPPPVVDPPGWPFPSSAPVEQKLEDVELAFAEAGKKAAMEGKDFDIVLEETEKLYPRDFVEEHVLELHKKFADGFEIGDPDRL